MLQVELREGTSVFTAGGEEVGKINRFVLDPQTNEVTHIVVQRGWLLSEDKVVPLSMIHSATEDRVQLNEDVTEFDELPPFEETHYVRMDEDRASHEATTDYASDRAAPGFYWYPPHGYLGYPAYGLGYPAWPLTETQQNIPANTVPLEENTKVISSDDNHVGDVERLLVDTDSNKATHFIISQGMLFKDRKLVPVSWIKSITEEEVRLIVSSKVLEQLPSYAT
ncbi:MAG TPA: PRC-barrel domain-containing protein [Anaerolineales bacterium]|nr:PRC-barrel domain-containing protein [Anaerolineales bacterium]